MKVNKKLLLPALAVLMLAGSTPLCAMNNDNEDSLNSSEMKTGVIGQIQEVKTELIDTLTIANGGKLNPKLNTANSIFTTGLNTAGNIQNEINSNDNVTQKVSVISDQVISGVKNETDQIMNSVGVNQNTVNKVDNVINIISNTKDPIINTVTNIQNTLNSNESKIDKGIGITDTIIGDGTNLIGNVIGGKTGDEIKTVGNQVVKVINTGTVDIKGTVSDIKNTLNTNESNAQKGVDITNTVISQGTNTLGNVIGGKTGDEIKDLGNTTVTVIKEGTSAIKDIGKIVSDSNKNQVEKGIEVTSVIINKGGEIISKIDPNKIKAEVVDIVHEIEHDVDVAKSGCSKFCIKFKSLFKRKNKNATPNTEKNPSVKSMKKSKKKDK